MICAVARSSQAMQIGRGGELALDGINGLVDVVRTINTEKQKALRRTRW